MTYPLFLINTDDPTVLRPVNAQNRYRGPYRFSCVDWAKEFLNYYYHNPIAAEFVYRNRERHGNN